MSAIEAQWFRSIRNDIPEGFDGVYRCKNHPDREVVAPIACRSCQECHDLAIRNYAEHHDTSVQWRTDHDLSTRSEPLTKVRREKITNQRGKKA